MNDASGFADLPYVYEIVNLASVTVLRFVYSEEIASIRGCKLLRECHLPGSMASV
jgi:hypothetical protein